jgi:hemin uptake protein HemP
MEVKIKLPGHIAGPHDFSGKTSKMIADKTQTNQPQQQPAAHVRTIESAEIFRGQSEIVIRHENFTYRLKITRQGKLILNK